MASQTSGPTLGQKFGSRLTQAAAKAAKAPVRYGPESLPPGVKNGVARVTGARIVTLKDDVKMKQLDGSSAAGQFQLAVDAAAVSPDAVAGPGGTPLAVKGRKLKTVFIPLFDKGSSFWARWVAFSPSVDLDFSGLVSEACNFMRMLAGPDFDTSNFEAAVKALDSAKPHFEFETVEKPAGGKNPATGQPYPAQTMELWGRGVKAPAKTAGSGVRDETGKAAAEANGHAQAPAEAEDGGGVGGGGVGGGGFSEFGDLESLADLADSDETAAATEGTPENDAAAKLTQYAVEHGVPEEEFSNYANWREILAAAAERAGGGEAEDEDDVVEEDAPAEEEKEWEKGDECDWVPPVKGPGGKEKPGTKAVRCKVVGLNKSKTKANVIDAKDSKKKWTDVPVDALTRPA